MSKILGKIKEDILEWGGLPIEGETKEDLIASLNSVHWSLECDLNHQKELFEERINKLKIKES